MINIGYELVMLWKPYQKYCVDNNLRPTLEGWMKWIEQNDTNKNPHRYPNNPDLPQEKE